MVTRAQLDRLASRVEQVALSLGVVDADMPDLPPIVLGFDDGDGLTQEQRRAFQTYVRGAEARGQRIEWDVELVYI